MIPGPHKNYTHAKYASPSADNIEFGPAMKALNPRQQALVLYLLDTGTDNWTEAVTEVGYEGSYATLRVTASRLRRDPKIGMAIAEVGRQRPSFDLPMALRTIRTIAADPSHKDAGKMALALAGMSGVSPVARSEQAVTVTHHLDPMAAIEAKLAILEASGAVAVAATLRKQLLPPEMIDVTPEPVAPVRVPDSVPERDITFCPKGSCMRHQSCQYTPCLAPELTPELSEEDTDALLADLLS
jgi:hypothetical protein